MAQTFDADAAWAVVQEQLREQGLPERVEDEAALRRVAGLLTAGGTNKARTPGTRRVAVGEHREAAVGAAAS